jgi:hypothetical protein
VRLAGPAPSPTRVRRNRQGAVRCSGIRGWPKPWPGPGPSRRRRGNSALGRKRGAPSMQASQPTAATATKRHRRMPTRPLPPAGQELASLLAMPNQANGPTVTDTVAALAAGRPPRRRCGNMVPIRAGEPAAPAHGGTPTQAGASSSRAGPPGSGGMSPASLPTTPEVLNLSQKNWERTLGHQLNWMVNNRLQEAEIKSQPARLGAARSPGVAASRPDQRDVLQPRGRRAGSARKRHTSAAGNAGRSGYQLGPGPSIGSVVGPPASGRRGATGLRPARRQAAKRYAGSGKGGCGGTSATFPQFARDGGRLRLNRIGTARPRMGEGQRDGFSVARLGKRLYRNTSQRFNHRRHRVVRRREK